MPAKRLNSVMYLDRVYAPNEKEGFYHVLSEFVGVFCGAPCVMGYIILSNGKPKRVWFNV